MSGLFDRIIVIYSVHKSCPVSISATCGVNYFFSFDGWNINNCVKDYDYSPTEVAKIRYQAAYAYIPSDASEGDVVKAWLIIFDTFQGSQVGKDVYANLIRNGGVFEFNAAFESCRDALVIWAKKGYDAAKLKKQLSQVVINSKKAASKL